MKKQKKLQQFSEVLAPKRQREKKTFIIENAFFVFFQRNKNCKKDKVN